MTTHLDTPGEPGTLVRTGKLVPFLEVSIGEPFWAHGAVWIRTAYDAASQLGNTSQRRYGHIFMGNCCNFLIDEIDKEVEAMTYSSQDMAAAWAVPAEG